MKKRPYVKDLGAGVDPTGKFTFQYGIQDAGKPKSELRSRRAVGMVGGLIGGGLALPSLGMGAVGTAQAVDMLARKKPPKEALKHIWKSVKMPITHPIAAARYMASLRRARSGLAPRHLDIHRAEKALEAFGDGLPPGVKKMLSPTKELAAMATLSPKAWDTVGKRVHEVARTKLRDGLIAMGIAGGVSAGSTLTQHASGTRTGKLLSAKDRKRA